VSAALLLLAAALLVAPWSGPAAGRLRDLAPVPGRGASPRRSRRVDAARGALARALDAGLPTHAALAAVADALEGADSGIAAPLRAVAARVHLGVPPAQAWEEVPGAERLAPVASVLARVTDGGGSVRAALAHAAERMRSEADAAAVARAERAAVLVAGPLGLCFLPAFVCLGVVPVVVGLADGMLPGILP
jgi:pilus assembly protein TadC